MRANAVSLFDRAAHNPTFAAIRAQAAYDGPLVDFCVPVNCHFPPPRLLGLVREHLLDLLTYYPDQGDENRRRIAALAGVDPANIVVGNGSTEIITQICYSAAGPLVTPIPTFGRWTDLPPDLGLRVRTVEARRVDDFKVSVDDLVDAVREVSARCVVICNPNNPTGASFSGDEIRALVEDLAGLDLIVIDESFIDFSDLATATEYALRRKNVIVVKSLGKSIGWHGIRLGYAVANRALAQTLRLTIPYWNVNGLASFVLQQLGVFEDEYRASFERVKADRRYMAAKLEGDARLTVYPSQANFLYVELPAAISGTRLRDDLLHKHGIIVRECGNKDGSSSSHLRLAVRERKATDALMRGLAATLPLAEALAP